MRGELRSHQANPGAAAIVRFVGLTRELCGFRYSLHDSYYLLMLR